MLASSVTTFKLDHLHSLLKFMYNATSFNVHLYIIMLLMYCSSAIWDDVIITCNYKKIYIYGYIYICRKAVFLRFPLSYIKSCMFWAVIYRCLCCDSWNMFYIMIHIYFYIISHKELKPIINIRLYWWNKVYWYLVDRYGSITSIKYVGNGLMAQKP